jgi:hypothetical protein
MRIETAKRLRHKATVHVLIDITRSTASSLSTSVIRAFIPFPFGYAPTAADKMLSFYYLFLNFSLCQFSFSVGGSVAPWFLAGLFHLVFLLHLS